MTKRQKLEAALSAALALGVTEDELRLFLTVRCYEATLADNNKEDGEDTDWGTFIQGQFETAYDWAYDAAKDEIQDVNDFRDELDAEDK